MIFHQPDNSKGNFSYNVATYKDIDWQMHFHKNFEIIYVLSGEVICNVNGTEKTLKKGEFGMILSNEIHAYNSKGESLSWVIVFSDDFVHTFKKHTTDKIGERFDFKCNEVNENFIKENLINNPNPDIYTLKSCLYTLCGEYIRQVNLKEKTSKSEQLMQLILDYISINYKNNITLSHMAKNLGYNYHYLSKSFNRIFDMPFNDFLNSYRLDNALTLLTADSNKTITDIALESGFQSVRSFNQIFKSRVGISPSEYKKRL